ncbi:MAG: N-acetylmuramoyl-L-alanine amidase [Clostridiales bacterium]|nr:N-acetylmuramoyl-L-alanine amidase [Candidatus Crickella equi]
MQLTDDEIREILIRQRKQKKRRQRKLRRFVLLIIAVLVIVLAVGIFINRDARINSRGIIFIDAGHGGVDGGSKVGKRLEKEDTLALSLAVRDELESLGFKVCMSRTGDEDVDREERGKIANKKNAQLFLSIHRNQASEGEGVEVYIPSKNDKESRMLGTNVINALAEQGFTKRSVRVGTLITEKDDYVENSVPTMPSSLVEVGFMQNKHDNQLFDGNLENNAKAIALAIEATFDAIYTEEE